MSLGLALRRAIPQSLKNRLRQFSAPWRLSALLSPYLPPAVCIDVGASYYPHAKWLLFLNSPKVRWVAVEPNEANLAYVRSWAWPCQVSTCTTGLSRDGGPQTLFVTNVDTGSSLLMPEIGPAMQHRITNLDYFFPVRERRIETITLERVQQDLPQDLPVFVKLDTQGTELSILQGAPSMFDAQRIVGIELESTLQAQPIMKGAGKFWQACAYLEERGFELLHVKPIHAARRAGRARVHSLRYLNECDAIFALRQDVAGSLPVAHRASLLAFYLTNAFHEEGLCLLDADQGL
ncbi:MAG: FkbM family methyltransferase, partial [Inhella sp.]